VVRPLERGTDAIVDEFLAAANGAVILDDALFLATALSTCAQLLTFDERLRRIAAHEPRA
jgi:predicted nucleic acid-binding protein